MAIGMTDQILERFLLAIEHGCTLCSLDADFGRFAGPKWKNPLSQPRRASP